MKKLVFVTLITIIFSIYPGTAGTFADDSVPAPAIHAESCILIDAVSGNAIYEKNADKKEYPASTTKIMTAGLAIEMGCSGKKTTVSKNAVDMIGYNGSNAGLKAGEAVQYDDLLNMALISSANDAANAIAEGVAGSIGGFVTMMNDKAARLGLTNTHFSNPVGLDSGDGYPDHRTTARDLAQIMRFSTSEDIFRDIIGESRYLLPVTNLHQSGRGYKTSTDLLLTDPAFQNDAYTVVGGKTGYTQAARNVFVACARNDDGIELILVLMKDEDRGTMFRDAADLFDYGFKLVDKNPYLAQKGFYDIRGRSSEDLINRYYQSGYIKDAGDGKFDYDGSVTREEFLQVLGNVKDGLTNGSEGSGKTYLDRAISEGLADESWKGTGNKIMTRGDMITIMSPLVGVDPDMAELLTMIRLIKDIDKIPNELRWDTFRVYKAGLISGRADGTVGVDKLMTREEMVLILNNYSKYSKPASNLVRMVFGSDSLSGVFSPLIRMA